MESYALYAQVLSDQNNFDRADELYEEAIKIDPLNANLLVHRGLITLQWKGDIVKAVELITKYVFSFHEFFTFDIYVNFQKKNTFHEFFHVKKLSLYYRALDVDDKCEFAFETLEKIQVQRGNLSKAVNLFEDSSDS